MSCAGLRRHESLQPSDEASRRFIVALVESEQAEQPERFDEPRASHWIAHSGQDLVAYVNELSGIVSDWGQALDERSRVHVNEASSSVQRCPGIDGVASVKLDSTSPNESCRGCHRKIRPARAKQPFAHKRRGERRADEILADPLPRRALNASARELASTGVGKQPQQFEQGSLAPSIEADPR